MCSSRAHAFRTEYTGGFDVVIGNPPYVQLQSLGEMSEKLKNCGYETFDKVADLYCLFTERAYNLLNKGGSQSFIMPNKWMLVAYGKPLRKFLSKTGLRQILNFGDIQFFEEATTYVCIFVTQKAKIQENVKALSLNKKTYHNDFLFEVKTNSYDYPSSRFSENEWSIQPQKDFIILEKMRQKGIELKKLPVSINYGIKTGYNDAFYINEETKAKLIAADAKSAELIKPMLRGRDIAPYGNTGFEFLINTHNGLKDKEYEIPAIDINDYPAIKEHLNQFYTKLKKRGDKGVSPYNLRNCAYLNDFAKPKIMYPNMTSVFPFMYDESGLLSNDKSFILSAKDDSVSLPFLTAVFNSSLAKRWIWYNCPELQGGTREIRKVYFEHFPVPHAHEEQTEIIANLALTRTKLTEQLQNSITKFNKYLLVQTNNAKLSRKLESWHEITFSDFIKELNKAIKKSGGDKLSKTDEMEWMEVFENKKQEAQAIKSEIEKTDQEINRMVYKLYALTEEEIAMVEEAIQ